jgi:gamma-tubulin complex component 2
VERLLLATWLDHTKLKQQFQSRKGEHDEMAFIARMSLLGGKMLHFVQEYMYFMFFEVIEPNWEKMENALGEVSCFWGTRL